MKHGRPKWGEEANVGAAPPLKNHENKGFATYSSLWGAFSPCECLSATFSFTYGGSFRHVGDFLLLFSPMGGLFAMWGPFSVWEAFLGLPPTLQKFLRVPMGHAMTSI